MGTGKVLGHQTVGFSALHLLPITTAVTEHSDSGQDGLSILSMLLHLITIFFFSLDGHWPNLKPSTVARLFTLDLQNAAGSGRYLLYLLLLVKGGHFQDRWFTCQHLDLARATILSCTSSYQVHHLFLHVHTYRLDSLKECFENQSKKFPSC